MAYFCIGLVRGYVSPALQSMKEITPHLLPNREIQDWIVSVSALGSLTGSLSAFPILHRFGRKHVIICASPLWVMSWFLIASCHSWQVFIVGRFFSGLCIGFVIPSAQIYVSESCNPKIRGVLGSMPALFLSLGILTSYVTGTLLNWRQMAWINMIISGSLFFVMLPLPHSPIWLKLKRQYENSEIARIRWIC